MEIIKVQNATYEYKQFESAPLPALKGVSLSVIDGEFLTLVGANGSGKSTLAKLLNGLMLPKSGTVTVFGNLTTDESKVFDIRKNVGMVFQNPDNQMVATIVEDDVAFGPENIGVPRDEIIKRVEWALNAVGMLSYREATPFKMSGGQKQRIAIASILAMKPKVLVLDEATSMLDPKGRREIMSILTRLNKDEGITIIHITHHMDEVIEADRVIVLDEGLIVAEGSPRELFKQDISKYKLTLPVAAEIARKLNAVGIDVGDDIITPEELIEKICLL
ncbi:MAG: energy-coupling factor transporter ATPase [Clostridia bacterium]